jgi:hypothetical protein
MLAVDSPHMRRLDISGEPEPLPKQEVAELLTDHLPYRLAHLLDAIPRIPARCMADNQAFEAGAVAGRALLSFLGVGYSNKAAAVTEDRRYQRLAGDMTDDVKAPDVGGSFVDIRTLSVTQQNLLARFIHGVHKASAHFTWKSQHGLDVATYREAAVIIKDLLNQHIPHGAEPQHGADQSQPFRSEAERASGATGSGPSC